MMAGAMTSWLNIVHGYYGQFMYDIPSTVRLRIIDRDTRQVRQMTVSSDFIPE